MIRCLFQTLVAIGAAALAVSVGQLTGRHMRAVLLLVLIVLATACPGRQRQNQAEVEQAQLTALVGQADFITVLDEPYQNGKVIWASSAKSDIEEFQEAATIRVSPNGGHCLCLGYPAIRLYRRQAEILRITSFDWKTIRWQTTVGPVWHDDVALENPTRWRRWFDSRRIPPSAGR